MRVEILQIWISPGHDFRGRHGSSRLNHSADAKEAIHCVAGKGLEGDRYFGFKDNFKGQITFFSEEVAAQLQADLDLPELDRSVMRRNVLIRGVDLNGLIGHRFQLGDVLLSGSEECAPCYWMNEAVGPGAHERLKGHGGLRCRIERSGTLTRGPCQLEIVGEANPCPA